MQPAPLTPHFLLTAFPSTALFPASTFPLSWAQSCSRTSGESLRLTRAAGDSAADSSSGMRRPGSTSPTQMSWGRPVMGEGSGKTLGDCLSAWRCSHSPQLEYQAQAVNSDLCQGEQRDTNHPLLFAMASKEKQPVFHAGKHRDPSPRERHFCANLCVSTRPTPGRIKAICARGQDCFRGWESVPMSALLASASFWLYNLPTS